MDQKATVLVFRPDGGSVKSLERTRRFPRMDRDVSILKRCYGQSTQESTAQEGRAGRGDSISS